MMSDEASAITSAYEDRIQLLFTQLMTALGDQPVSHETDKKCLDKFLAGLAVARRARDLALGAINPEPAAAMALSKSR